MKKIEDFIEKITFTRKRNAILFLEENNSNVLSQMKAIGLNIFDLAKESTTPFIVSDDAFLNLIHACSLGKPTVILNPELYLAPRFRESTYLKSLLPKLMHSEPFQPIFLVFYSKSLYRKFKSYYQNNPATSDHWFESES